MRGERSLGKQIFFFALPYLLTAELQLLFNTVDLIVIGRFAGSMALAAVGATTALVNMIVGILMGVSVGSTVCVANHIGARHDEGVRTTSQTSFCIGLLTGGVMMAIGLLGARMFLVQMQTPDEILDAATLYFRIYALALPAISVYNFGAAVCRGAGDSKRPLYILTASGVANAGMNLLFVIVFHMEVAGVATATAIANYGAAVAMVVFLCRAKDARRLELRGLRLHLPTLRRICRIGFPAALQSCLFNIANIAIAASVNTLGATIVAGNAACSSVENFAYTGTGALSQSAVTFIGQQIGAGEHKRLGKTLGWCLTLVCGFAWILAFVLLAFGEPLIRLYITDNELAVTEGLHRMRVMLWTFFLCGTMDTLTNTLRGMGASRTPMFITLFGVCAVRFAWIAWVFPHHHTLVGLYIIYPITYSIAIACQLVAFFVIKRNLSRRAEHHEMAASQSAAS
jgi:putative MATE family efflux protein